MDYDKLIERLKSAAGGPDGIKMCQDAALAIKTLRADLARVTAERDGAIDSIPHDCKTCAYHVVFFCTNPDGGCSNNYNRWEWRGQKED